MPRDWSPAPSPPKSVFPDEEDLGDAGWNGLFLELAPFGLERLDDYAPGGQHPVHLGDLLGPGRRGPYRVLHKLGSGGYANVWLCQDVVAETSTQYIALKVLASDVSTEDCQERRVGKLRHGVGSSRGKDAAKYLCLPLDEFEIRGPNGTHLCLVYPVLGPTVAQGAFRRSPSLDSVLRKAGRQTAIGVDILHRQGICHGDITPNNILHRISGLDGLTEDEVLKVVGTPSRNGVLQEGGEPHKLPSAPQYLVYPVKWTEVDMKYIEPESCLIDLGQSFDVSQPPGGDDLGTPGPYRSPELILDKAAGIGSDLWALGCTLFEIRTGRKLFGLFDDDDDSYLDAMVQVFGRLPEPWWSTTWESRRRMYKDESDESGRAVAAVAAVAVRETPEGDREDGVEIVSRTHSSVAQDARSIQEMLAPGLWYLDGKDNGGEYHEDIPESEKKAFADLLGRLLAYDPTVRPQSLDLVNHRWFSC